jgi:hypothetical protein
MACRTASAFLRADERLWVDIRSKQLTLRAY